MDFATWYGLSSGTIYYTQPIRHTLSIMRLFLVAAVAVQLFAISAAAIAADTDESEQKQQTLEPPTNAQTERAYKRWVEKINAESVKYLGDKDARKVRVEIRSMQQLTCDPVKNQPNSLLCRARIEAIVGDEQTETSTVARVFMTRTGVLWTVE